MIYTMTLNPAVDRALQVEALLSDDTTRIVEETVYAAGKGIDVSRVIHELGGYSVALGLVGGYAGSQLTGLLINAGVVCHFVTIGGETRTNLLLKERTTGRQYVISAKGPQIGPAEIGQLYEQVREIGDMNYLVISGSLPVGVTPHVYSQFIMTARRAGAFVMLDADGDALREALEHGPTCIKPNQHELGRLVGRTLETEEEVLSACRQVHGKGVERVLVSRGSGGLVYSTAQGLRRRAVAPPVVSQGAVGAGDSVVAGFLLAHSRGYSEEDCLRWGCAAGTATAEAPGTQLCRRGAVERILPLVEISSI